MPDWLADQLDWHVWPSASPWAITGRARTVCEHIDCEQIWLRDPALFARRGQVGAPALPTLWAAKQVLAEHGAALVFDLQLELIEDQLALAIYGAGVVGRLSDPAWSAVSGMLTTCSCVLREPRADSAVSRFALRPARAPNSVGKRPFPNPVVPELWQVGDWVHTWWDYPHVGTVREDCDCPAHTPTAAGPPWGPRTRAGP